jgi:hypothetical protein
MVRRLRHPIRAGPNVRLAGRPDFASYHPCSGSGCLKCTRKGGSAFGDSKVTGEGMRAVIK